MKELSGKTAVVTGAASGIGLALATRFAEEGMQVVLADIEDDALVEATRTLEEQGHDVHAIRTDVTQWQDVADLAQGAIGRYGTVHVVCNNAGVGGGAGTTWELTLDDWRWTVNVNLWGVIHGERAFLPHLLEHGEEAHIVNTASLAGHFANAGMAPYTATKYAVVGMSECLALELAAAESRVHVSVLCPPFVATRIHESHRNRPPELADTIEPTPEREAAREAVGQMIAAGAAPSEMADAVVEAIRYDKFWVIPYPIAIAAIEARFRTIRDDTDPFDPMAAFRRGST
jgi:NAD(P)-dependent dehydrogenase (short-subunit alcohol dehydrogenase family)